MLCICVGTDILPAISLAYEEAEPDIMTRKPRKKTDRMVSRKLITHAYLIQGWIATAAGFMGYFVVMYHYGFTMEGLFGMCEYPAYPRPQLNSSFNPLLFNMGNSMLGTPYFDPSNNCNNYNQYLYEMTNEIDWVWINDANYDLRNILV
jgi:sodium/potassium-transporting ATPase subunit alpha